MTSLGRFLEPITVANKPIGNEYTAYKMDSTDKNKDMRKIVGLGTCHCCDYFLSHGNSIALIEETCLKKSLQYQRGVYHYLSGKDKKDFSNKKIREEIHLKAYGSMLVLCRLTEKCHDVKKLFQNKKYCFWIVASDMNEWDIKVFDNLRDELRGILSKKLVDAVEVLSPEDLRNKLSQQ